MSDWRTMRGAVGMWAVLAGAALMLGCAQTAGTATESGLSADQMIIVVKRVRAEDHRETAELIAETLKKTRGIRRAGVAIYEESGGTMVAYGRYGSVNDRVAQQDLRLIKSLQIPNEGYVFLEAHFEPAPEPDPAIDASWVLTNSKGFWTLEIARFDGQGRKRAAVDFVKQLRGEGVEAYAWHQTVKSVVTVGAYGEKAVGAITYGPARRPVVTNRPVAVDAQLKAMQRRFRYLIINATYVDVKAVDSRTAKSTNRERRKETQIIRVPRPDGSEW